MSCFEWISFKTPDELAARAAGAWLDEIDSANHGGADCCVAVSGGRIAATFFAATAQQAKQRGTSFAHTHFFWADERCVPPDDPESNYRIASEALLRPLGIPDDRVHRVRGELAPDGAATLAQEELCRIAAPDASGLPILDLVLLGLGEDGHVASLFPGESEESASSPRVYRAVANSPKPPPNRITLGYGVIAAAHQVWMLASGAGKEKALRESLSREGRTPFARVLRMRSSTRIFSDIAAGSVGAPGVLLH